MALLKLIITVSLLMFVSACANEDLKFRDNLLNPEKNDALLESSIDFSTINNLILTPHCVGCHKGFSDYDRVVSRIAGINDSIISNRMPKGAPALSAEEKKLLQLWIDLGTPKSIAPVVGPSVE